MPFFSPSRCTGLAFFFFGFHFNCILFNRYEATEIVTEFTVPAAHVTYRCFNWLLKLWRARCVSWRLVYINARFCEEISSVRELDRWPVAESPAGDRSMARWPHGAQAGRSTFQNKYYTGFRWQWSHCCLPKLDLNNEGLAGVILVLCFHAKPLEVPPCYCRECVILPARLGPMWWVSVTEDDLCFGIVSKFAPKDPFEWDPWLKIKQ